MIGVSGLWSFRVSFLTGSHGWAMGSDNVISPVTWWGREWALWEPRGRCCWDEHATSAPSAVRGRQCDRWSLGSDRQKVQQRLVRGVRVLKQHRMPAGIEDLEGGSRDPLGQL